MAISIVMSSFTLASAKHLNELELEADSNVVYSTELPEHGCYMPFKKNKSIMTDHLIVVVPDIMVSPKAYRALVDRLLKTLPDEFAALILKFNNLKPSFNKSKGCINQATNYLSSTGMLSEDYKITVAGHSFGGIVAQDLADHYKRGSLVLLASYLTRSSTPFSQKRTLKNIKYPALFLGGTADGFTKAPWILREFIELESLIDNPDYGPEYRYRTPVILLKSVKNSHFSDGKPSKYDLPSFLRLNTAHGLITNTIKNFLIANKAHDSTTFDEIDAQEALEYEFDNTASILESFKFSTKNYERICATGQNDLLSNASVNTNYVKQVTVKNLNYFPTSITHEDSSTPTIQAGYYVEPNSNWADISIGPFFGDKVICNFIIPVQEELDEQESANNGDFYPRSPSLEAAKEKIKSVCTELNNYALIAGKSLASKQDIWPISENSEINIRPIDYFDNLWKFEKEIVFSQSDSNVTPHYHVRPHILNIKSTNFYQASCSVLSIPSVLEWYTINSHVIKKLNKQ